MAIAFRAAASNKNEATGTDVLVTYPATVVAGDAMLLFVAYSGTAITCITPSGWTLVAGPFDKSTVLRGYLFSKVAAGTEASTTLTITASASGATKRYAQLGAWSGTSSSPVGVSASFVETTAGTTHSAATVNLTPSNCWIVEFIADRGSPGSTGWTQPSGYSLRDTQVGTGGGGATLGLADSNATVTPSGTAGGGTWTGTLSTANALGFTVAIQPQGLSAPTGLTATPISSSRIDLDWDDSAGATGYDVERDGSIIASPTSSAYSDTGLSPSTLYTYRVRSTN